MTTVVVGRYDWPPAGRRSAGGPAQRVIWGARRKEGWGGACVGVGSGERRRVIVRPAGWPPWPLRRSRRRPRARRAPPPAACRARSAPAPSPALSPWGPRPRARRVPPRRAIAATRSASKAGCRRGVTPPPGVGWGWGCGWGAESWAMRPQPQHPPHSSSRPVGEALPASRGFYTSWGWAWPPLPRGAALHSAEAEGSVLGSGGRPGAALVCGRAGGRRGGYTGLRGRGGATGRAHALVLLGRAIGVCGGTRYRGQ
jgi:hypothetical protein